MTKLISTTVCALLLASSAFGSSVTSSGSNNSVGSAQDIDASFSMEFQFNIGNYYVDQSLQHQSDNTSTTIPHVTISGTGDGTFDYFSFTVEEAGLGIFDIDYGLPDMDSWLTLYTDLGVELDHADDSPDWQVVGRDADNVNTQAPYDSFLQYNFTAAGTYVIRVGQTDGGADPTGVAVDKDYVLHVSLDTFVAPPPTPDNGSTLVLFAIALLATFGIRRRSVKA